MKNPIILTTFHGLSGHVNLVATIVNSVDRKLGYYVQCRKQTFLSLHALLLLRTMLLPLGH